MSNMYVGQNIKWRLSNEPAENSYVLEALADDKVISKIYVHYDSFNNLINEIFYGVKNDLIPNFIGSIFARNKVEWFPREARDTSYKYELYAKLEDKIVFQLHFEKDSFLSLRRAVNCLS